MCEHRYSKGSHWRAGCKISTICQTKRPGSRRAENEEQFQARYNKTDFLEHLANRANYIYHKLVLEFEALESCLNKAYGDRILLYFKQSNIHYAHMFWLLCRETRAYSSAEFLMVDCKPILETRKWASFYTKKEKVGRRRENAQRWTWNSGKCSASVSATGWERRACHVVKTGIQVMRCTGDYSIQWQTGSKHGACDPDNGRGLSSSHVSFDPKEHVWMMDV